MSGVATALQFLFGSTAPAVDGTASAGSSSTAARSDHAHPTDTSRLAAAGAIFSPQGRLTLTSGAPVLSSSVNGATTVRYTPYLGNLIPLWTGSAFVPTAFSELSASTSSLAANTVYDLFVWLNGGTATLIFGPAWSAGATAGSNAVRGSGAGSSAISRVNGLIVNAVAISGGPAAGYGTYVGTVWTDGSAATVSWTLGTSAAGGGTAQLGVFNAYNRRPVRTTVQDSTASWTPTSSFGPIDGNAKNRAGFVVGLTEEPVIGEALTRVSLATSVGYQLGIDFTSTTATPSKYADLYTSAGTQILSAFIRDHAYLLGASFVAGVEKATAGSPTVYGGADMGITLECWL